MNKRASLPGASELFRRTSAAPAFDGAAIAEPTQPSQSIRLAGSRSNGQKKQLVVDAPARRGSGRQKHDAKITVYVSEDELLAMEQTRLKLRAGHDLAVDRGRLVREAVAVLLADFEQYGEDSVLVRRLRDGGVHNADDTDGKEAAD